MKIVSEYFSNVDGIAVFPIISIILFFVFFIIVGVRVFRLDKKYVNELSHYPINDDK